MIILMNSSKTLDFKQQAPISKHTIPELIKDSEILIKEFRNGSYRFITIYAKKARGLMCNYIIQNHIDRTEELKLFRAENYQFNQKLSSHDEWVFTRGD